MNSHMTPIKYSNTDRERVYKQLKRAITSGEIKPNERIVETVYAERFMLSRTPVREALHMLERDGLVIYIPKKGAMARSLPTETEAEEVFSLRSILQLYGVDATVKNITKDELAQMKKCNDSCLAALENDDVVSFFHNHDRFNLLLVQGCKQPLLIKLLLQIETLNPITSFAGQMDEGDISRVRETAVPNGKRQFEAVQEHIKIWETLVARDTEAYRKALTVHLDNSKKACMEGVISNRNKVFDDV